MRDLDVTWPEVIFYLVLWGQIISIFDASRREKNDGGRIIILAPPFKYNPWKIASFLHTAEHKSRCDVI